jgi:RimJ/RimL family protein N-acetyltransferase
MEIRTERLLLREFVESDWQAVLAYQRDPRYLRFYPSDDRSEDEVRRFVQMFVDNQRVQPRIKYQLAVVLPPGGVLIGNCGIRKGSIDALQADIGYELAPHAWGQGYATEAALAVLEFGFSQLNVYRIWANCLAENTASRHVLEKLGMRLEGQLRANEYFKGRWWDTMIYAILKPEWEASGLLR